MKRLFRFVTVLTLCAFCAACAFATGSDAVSVSHADTLHALHLFRGTGVNDDGSPVYSLEQSPSRLQGLIMMIRFLGEEEAALACEDESPFTDVSGEAEAYVSYAYRRGVTNGTTASTFTPGTPLSANAYLAFLLRAMGYTEAGGDYAWDNIMPFAVSLGILSESDADALEADSLNRGDMVDLSYRALHCLVKGGESTLAQALIEKGVFTEAEARSAGVLSDSTHTVAVASENNFEAFAPVTSGDSPVSPLPWEAPADSKSTVEYEKKSVHTSEGLVTAHVLTVNTSNPPRAHGLLYENRAELRRRGRGRQRQLLQFLQQVSKPDWTCHVRGDLPLRELRPLVAGLHRRRRDTGRASGRLYAPDIGGR